MCTLVAAGHGDALSHLLARRRVLFVVLLHVATLFGCVHLVPAEVRDLCVSAVEQKRVDGVMGTLACDDDSQRRGDACFFNQRPARAAGPRPSKNNEFEFRPINAGSAKRVDPTPLLAVTPTHLRPCCFGLCGLCVVYVI